MKSNKIKVSTDEIVFISLPIETSTKAFDKFVTKFKKRFPKASKRVIFLTGEINIQRIPANLK